MLILFLGLSSVAFMGLWLLEVSRHAQSARRLAHQSKMRHAKLANAIIRMRHAFVSDIYKLETLPQDQLLKEAFDAANLLAECELLVEKLTADERSRTLLPDVTPYLDDVQQLVARCGAFKDQFFRDTGLFYLAGVLEYGGRSDEAQFLRNALKHGTLRAKASKAHLLLLNPSLPSPIRSQLLAGGHIPKPAAPRG